jgi:hypothetical protein
VTPLAARILYSILGGLAACLACHPIFESDPYWHMSLGREVLRQGSRVVSEKLAHPSFPTTCVVAEWLWDVLVYGLHTAFGEPGVVAAAMLCAALFVLALKTYLGREDNLAAQAIIATLVLATCLWRFEARPEMAALVILPLFLCLCARFETARDQGSKLRLSLLLALLTVLWAQLHGSFVLAPVLVMLSAGSVVRSRERLALRLHGLLFVLVLGACLSGAHGLSIANYILAHSSGDATRHIMDMKSAALTTLAPFAKSAFGSLFLIWLLAGVAVLRGRGSAFEVGSALLGIALFFDAHRFAGFASLLAAKLALQGLDALAAPLARRTHTALGSLAILALGAGGWALHDLRGPLLHWQRNQVGHPTLASRWLRSLPAASSVLTDYVGGAELGFWLDGHVRTFVDGRTPLYFDDTDMAVSRDLELSPEAFERVRERYGFQAAVVSRHGYACTTLARIWTPVVVEGLYTTFVPKQPGAVALAGLEACGSELFSQRPCASSDLSAALVQLRRLTGDSDFLRFVEGAREGICGDAAEGLSMLPDASSLWPLRSQLFAARAQTALRAGQTPLAEQAIAAALRSQPLMTMRVAAMPELDALDLATRRTLLEALIAETDDATPAWLRSRLAAICAEQRDEPCAYFHALRAAIAGNLQSLPVLNWLAQNAMNERVRKESATYQAILEQEVRAH